MVTKATGMMRRKKYGEKKEKDRISLFPYSLYVHILLSPYILL
jgi:hypothetical protein